MSEQQPSPAKTKRTGRTMTRLKAGCGLLLVFSAGFLCGVIALFVLLVRVIPLSEGWKAEESKRFITNHLARRLALSDEQQKIIRPLIHEGLDERWRIRKEYLLRDRDLVEERMKEVERHLDEEQKERVREGVDNWWKGKQMLVMPKE